MDQYRLAEVMGDIGSRYLIAMIVIIVYGVFCVIGGIIGYAKAKSRASLIAGSVSGLILFVCAWLFNIAIDNMSNSTGDKASITGIIGSLAVSVLLGGRFLMTWLRTKKLMPDLLMVILSAGTIVAVLRLVW